ncbi:MAG TPA: hypothetical protein VF219_07960 [Vicinamibacterales bacterium]
MGNRALQASAPAYSLIAAFLLCIPIAVVGCSKTEAVTPEKIDQQYGVPGAYTDAVQTSDGAIRGTLVPVTMADGRKAQLFVPQPARNEPHSVYLRDDQGLHPVRIKDSATRDQVVSAPAVVGSQPEPAHDHKRSWEKDALIIGGSAGAGTAIGAIAGGKKGAAVGAAAGGIGGLIYDLTTQHKN